MASSRRGQLKALCFVWLTGIDLSEIAFGVAHGSGTISCSLGASQLRVCGRQPQCATHRVRQGLVVTFVSLHIYGRMFASSVVSVALFNFTIRFHCVRASLSLGSAFLCVHRGSCPQCTLYSCVQLQTWTSSLRFVERCDRTFHLVEQFLPEFVNLAHQRNCGISTCLVIWLIVSTMMG